MNPSDPPSQNLNVSLFKDSYMSVERSQETHRKEVRKATQEAEGTRPGKEAPGKEQHEGEEREEFKRKRQFVLRQGRGRET